MRPLARGVLACLLIGLPAGCSRRDRMADELLRARDKMEFVAPLTHTYGGLPIEEAYRVQDALTRRLARRGEKVAGYKVGFASRGAQDKWGLTEPAYGRLLASMQVPDGGKMDASEFHSLRIEAEVAFVLARSIDRPLKDTGELKPYVRSVHAAFDIPDVRYDLTRHKRRIGDFIADNMAAHRYVLGPARDPGKVNVDNINIALTHDGRKVYGGKASKIMGSPWNVLMWLANALNRRGLALRAGDVVLTGAVDKAYAGVSCKVIGRYVGDCGALGRVTCIVVPPASNN